MYETNKAAGCLSDRFDSADGLRKEVEAADRVDLHCELQQGVERSKKAAEDAASQSDQGKAERKEDDLQG